MNSDVKKKKTGSKKVHPGVKGEGHQKYAPSIKKIVGIEFAPAIYPRQIELGKVYVVKKEIIEDIMESEQMIHIYTRTCGVEYGTPISICKADVERVIYC